MNNSQIYAAITEKIIANLETANVRKLGLDKNENYSGESSMNFKVAQPFKFAGLD